MARPVAPAGDSLKARIERRQGRLIARRQVAAFLGDPFDPFFWRDDGAAGSASGPDHLLEKTEDEAGRTGDHQDHADGVEADALNVDVGRELENRANSDQEYPSTNSHRGLIPLVKIGKRVGTYVLGAWAAIWQLGHQ
jgi:hypothetical protein